MTKEEKLERAKIYNREVINKKLTTIKIPKELLVELRNYQSKIGVSSASKAIAVLLETHNA